MRTDTNFLPAETVVNNDAMKDLGIQHNMVAIMSEWRGRNCYCGLLVVFISLASNSAQVTFKLVNTTTPVSSNSTVSTVTPAITPTGEVVTLVNNSSTMSSNISMLSSTESLTTPGIEGDCSSHSSCDECIRDVKCYYCLKDNFCRMYPACRVLPTSECPLSEVRWGATCDGKYLLVSRKRRISTELH
ncbi:uncharacterized protein LOC144872084 [Branchiostoma floridae x Branchiostoma japonicum]